MGSTDPGPATDDKVFLLKGLVLQQPKLSSILLPELFFYVSLQWRTLARSGRT